MRAFKYYVICGDEEHVYDDEESAVNAARGFATENTPAFVYKLVKIVDAVLATTVTEVE